MQLLSSVIVEVFVSKCDNEIVIFLIIWPQLKKSQSHYLIFVQKLLIKQLEL